MQRGRAGPGELLGAEGDAAGDAEVSQPAAGRECGVRGAPLTAAFPLLCLP